MNVHSIRPYFVEDITAKLRSVYFASMHRGINAAWVVFLLCLEYDIQPSFMKAEHIQEIMQEFKMKG